MDWTTKNSYEILGHLSKIKTNSSFDENAPLLTPRLEAIIAILDSSKIEYELRHFTVDRFKDRVFTNIYTTFHGQDDEPGIVFLAHHDIANADSENCQDNTASISHLIKMMLEFSKNPPLRTSHVMLVDTEEHVNVMNCGSQLLAEDIKSGKFGTIEVCINLELTGLGKEIWVSSFQSSMNVLEYFINELDATPVRTPFNDAAVIGHHGVPAFCLGTLPTEELNGETYPYTWSLCHSTEDTYDKISEDDMIAFTEKLIGLVS